MKTQLRFKPREMIRRILLIYFILHKYKSLSGERLGYNYFFNPINDNNSEVKDIVLEFLSKVAIDMGGFYYASV